MKNAIKCSIKPLRFPRRQSNLAFAYLEKVLDEAAMVGIPDLGGVEKLPAPDDEEFEGLRGTILQALTMVRAHDRM